MPSVRERVRNDLANGVLTGASPLTEVRGVGPYVEARLRRSLASRQQELTVQDLWDGTRRRTTTGLLRLLYRALQNERANQCVSTRIATERNVKAYHTGDVNEHAYEAIATLLEHQRRTRRVAYGPIPPRLPTRSSASKQCGCRTREECTAPCSLSDDGTACVPAHPRTSGFVGVVPHTSQREAVTNRSRVRRAARMRRTNALDRDPDSARDMNAQHSRTLAYDRRGSRLWRRPSPRVRHPA